MKANIGTPDKTVRILLAIIIAALYFSGLINGTVAIVLLILSGIFILTSFIGICPIYLALGISTNKKQK